MSVSGVLVGRERELSVLRGWLARATAGQPVVVLCGGEPGIGKTRLAEELAALASAQSVSTAWGRASRAEGAPACWLWRQVLRALSSLDGSLAIAERLRVADELGVLAPEVFPAAESSLSDSSPERRFEVFDAVCRFLGEVATQRGLLVALDDLHWADPASLLLLRHLAAHGGAGRLMVIATFRGTEPGIPDLVAELAHERVHRIDLDGLSVPAVARQLEALTGGPVSRKQADRVHELTGGNPFFVAQLAHALDTEEVPVTVRAAIEARMDRLSAPCRHLLRVAAVVGHEFSVAVVAQVIRLPVLSCVDALDEALAAGMVVPGLAEGQHRFVHALVRDAVEAGLSTSERLRLHRAVAEAMEAFYAGRLEPHLAELARHWRLASDAGGREQAVVWSRRAADDAMRRLCYEDAARLYRQALDYAGEHTDVLDRYHMMMGEARALHGAAQLAECVTACRQAAELARELGRADLVAEAALVMQPVAVAQLDSQTAQLCREALARLGDEPSPLRVKVLAQRAQMAVYLDELDTAQTASAWAIAEAQRCDDTAVMVAALRARHVVCSGAEGAGERAALAERMSSWDPRLALSWQVDVAFARGDLAGVAAALENLRWQIGAGGAPLARWHLLRQEAALAQARADFAAAIRLADEAFQVVTPLRHPAAFPVRMALLATVDHHIGVDPEAPHVQACLRTGPGAAATPGHAFRIMDLLCPAWVLSQAGHLEQARAKFSALGPVEGWRIPPFHELVLYSIGVLTAVRLGEAAALPALRHRLEPMRGMHVVSGIGVEHYLGPVELYLGLAAAHSGDLDPAVADLAAAVAACERAGAPAHLAEAQTELARALIDRGDLTSARTVAATAQRTAKRLGLAAVAARVPPVPSLTAREMQVAGAVARGLTNRQIAQLLHLSERTAQNHVQHILNKLGLANRVQIAAWVSGNEYPG